MSVQESTVHSSLESRYLSGLNHFESGPFALAVEDFLSCLSTFEDPRIQRLAKKYIGESYARMGGQELRAEKFESALNNFSLAVSQAAGYPDYHLGRARAHAGLGNRAEQERALRKALDLHPRYVDALLALAAFQYSESKDEALATFEMACKASEDLYGEPYQDVLAAHRTQEPSKVVSILLSIRPLGTSLVGELVSRALESWQAGKVVEAEESLIRALQLAPRYADVRCKYGRLLLDLGRVEDALSELRTSVEINPRYVEGLTYLGLALIRNGNEQEGADYLHRALEMDPLHPVAIKEVALVSARRSSK